MVDYGKVSVIMPNYNSEKYIKQAIESVLSQTYKNWELIIADDCSSDSSCKIVSSIIDDRIVLLTSKTNEGAAVARNKAIDKASGRWLAFLDSDDLWLPYKLEMQLSYMVSKNIAFSYTDYDLIDENGKMLFAFKAKRDVCTYEDLLRHNHIGCLTVVYDATKIGPTYMPVDAVKREDYACWLRILRKDISAYCLHKPMAKYRVHATSVSSNKIKMAKCQWNVYRNVERLCVLKSCSLMLNWAFYGFLKYR